MAQAREFYASDEEIGQLRELLRDFDANTHNATGENWRALGDRVRQFAAYCGAQGAKADEKRKGKR
jgi:hypothetical protein